MALNYLDNLGITRLKEVGKILQIPRYSTFKSPDELREHIRSFLDENSRVRQEHLERIGRTQGQVRRLTAHIRELVEKRFGKGPELRRAVEEIKHVQAQGACLPDETVALLRSASGQSDRDVREMISRLIEENKSLIRTRDEDERRMLGVRMELSNYQRDLAQNTDQYRQRVAQLSEEVQKHVHDKAVADQTILSLQSRLDQVAGLPYGEIGQLQAALGGLQGELKAARTVIRSLRADLDAKTVQLARSRSPKVAQEAKSMRAELGEQEDDYQTKLQEYATSTEALRQRVQSLEVAGEMSGQELNQLRAQAEEHARVIAELTKERNELTWKKDELKKVRDGLGAQVAALTEEKEKRVYLDGVRDQEFDSANYNYAVQYKRADAAEEKLAAMQVRLAEIEAHSGGGDRALIEERDRLREALSQCNQIREAQRKVMEELRQQADRVGPLVQEVARLKALLEERENVARVAFQNLSTQHSVVLATIKETAAKLEASKAVTDAVLEEARNKSRLCGEKLAATLQELDQCHTNEGKLRLDLEESNRLQQQYKTEVDRLQKLYRKIQGAPAKVADNFRKQLGVATQQYQKCVDAGKQLKQLYDDLVSKHRLLQISHDEREVTTVEYQRLYNQCGLDLAKLSREAPLQLQNCIEQGQALKKQFLALKKEYGTCQKNISGNADVIRRQEYRIKELEFQLLEMMKKIPGVI